MTQAEAMVFDGPEQPLSARRFDLPVLGDGDVLVRVTHCTLCGSDLHTFNGRRRVPTPTILGHEILGRIEAFGAQAAREDATGRPLSVGDRVTWAIVASCGECFYCRRNLPAKCERGVKFGHEPLRPGQELTGGLASHCVLPVGAAIFRLPDHLADEVACPANCASATSAAVLEAAGELRDRAVLVFGAGMLGLTAAAMARSLGAAEVICCDMDAERRALALQFGATRLAAPEELEGVAQEATGGYGVDAAIELSGSTDALESGLKLVRTGGTIVLAGAVFPTRATSLEPERVVRRNLTIRGVHNYAPRNLLGALEFLATEGAAYPFAALVSRWHPLSEADAAFHEAITSKPHRIGLRPTAL